MPKLRMRKEQPLHELLQRPEAEVEEDQESILKKSSIHVYFTRIQIKLQLKFVNMVEIWKRAVFKYLAL